ncbi:hypothetical protein BJX99DRAFT_252520 [Aspergillus californicus]
MRENEQFSDLIIRCPSSSFQVHRCIVCPQSPFFNKAANGGFQEAKSHVDDITANQEGRLPTEHISQWRRAQTNVQIYIIADKYMIDGLIDMSKRKLNSNMENEWNDSGFITVVGDVYGSQCPPRSDLREVLLKFALRHLCTLKKSQRFHDFSKGTMW